MTCTAGMKTLARDSPDKPVTMARISGVSPKVILKSDPESGTIMLDSEPT